jgi:hypothetical protein
MGKPLMIQDADDERIERLKVQLGISRKIDVVRAGMDLLERQAERKARVSRWLRVVPRVASESRLINAEFRPHSRMKRA